MFVILGSNAVDHLIGLEKVFLAEQHVRLLMGGIRTEHLSGKVLRTLCAAPQSTEPMFRSVPEYSGLESLPYASALEKAATASIVANFMNHPARD
jgi:hypothetical protein